MIKTAKNSYLTLLMLLAMTIWGGSWPSAKALAATGAPEVLAFWRFLLTFISFIPIMIFLRLPWKIKPKAFAFAAFGALCIVAYNEFMFIGLKHGMASGGGLIVTTLNPILTFFLSALIFRKSLAAKDILGLAVGLIAGCFLLEIWALDSASLLKGGNLFFLGCSLSWASLTIASHNSDKYIPPLVFSFYVYGIAAVIDFFLSLNHSLIEPLSKGVPFWGNILYMSVASTTIATTIYFIASARRGSEKASSFIFTVPVAAVFFSWIFLKEIPELHSVIGGVIGISAVYILNSKMSHLNFLKTRLNNAEAHIPN